MSAPDTGTYSVHFEFYCTHSSTPRTTEETGPFQAVWDDLVIVWRHRTAAEFADDMVRRFFEGM